jgi:NAD(P)-dependent dehydrogenase (short-subunit alcohol dehydrogenase family)
MSKVVVITGASRGIGAATARLAARRGYAIGINYRSNRQAAEATARAVREAGASCVVVGADVAEEDEVVQLFETIDRELGRVTALVNNAGTLETQMRVEKMDAVRLARVFAVNVTGSFLCAREAIRRMSTRYGGRGGAIVNVSSLAARLGSPGEYIDYAASKGAIDTFTVGLAREVVADGIRVNAVRPGIVNTDIHASGGEPNRVDRVKGTIPMQRGGEPDEVAAAILWLLSDEASYTTGAILDVGGGR